MKCSIPEISWHNREPVLSVDIYQSGGFYRLATGGSDTFILIWQLKIVESGAVDIDILSELTRHQKAVNVVRWSPNGDFLASGDDDANIIIWHLKTDNIPLLEGDNNNKETWVVNKILRCHKEDVYDVCWAPNGTKLLSGSVDNTAILWDLNKGKSENILTDHKGFVQGVAWDPKNDYIATLSSDRICRLFHSNGKQVRARISRGLLPVEENHNLHSKEVKYFHDDTFKTFFRRLNFSPDGNLLVVPSGCVETEDCKNAMYATYIFTLDSLKQPAIILPSPAQCSIVVRCSPVYYELRPNGPKPYIDLPYRMIIAVATDSDVILYDTQQLSPFAHMQKIHYTRLTDLTWSHDGLLLAASSTDGFITLVTFEDQELGTVYKKEESETEEVEKPVVEEQVKKVEVVEEKAKPLEVKQKRSSFIEQWAKQGPKRKAEEEPVVDVKKIKSDEVIVIPSSPVKSVEVSKTPRKRITPITLKAVTPKKIKRNYTENKAGDEDIDSKEENNAVDSKENEENKSVDSKKIEEDKGKKIVVSDITGEDKGKKTVEGKITEEDNKAKKTIEVDKKAKDTSDVSKENKVVAQPKTPKRAQLITLRMGSSAKDEVAKSSQSEDVSTGKTNQKAPAVANVTKDQSESTTTSKEESPRSQRATAKNKELKDVTNKPKKRVSLIKIGECSKAKKSPVNKEEAKSTGLQSSLIAKLKTALNKPAPENTEDSSEKVESKTDEDHLNKQSLKGEAQLEKKTDSNSKKGSEEIGQSCKETTESDVSISNTGKTKTKVLDISHDNVEKTNTNESDVSNVDTDKTNTEESDVSNVSTKGSDARTVTTGRAETEGSNANNVNKGKTETKGSDARNVDTGKGKPKESDVSSTNTEETKTKPTKTDAKVNEDKDNTEAKKNPTKTEPEIIDLDNYKPPIKSPFPAKKIETPKRTSAKKTPKADDKISPGRNKKKQQSVTPKGSLLNFFKPITSDQAKLKTETTSDTKTMKPTSLFKNDNDKEKEGLVVIEDSNSADEGEVLKVKTTSLFKKNKSKGEEDVKKCSTTVTHKKPVKGSKLEEGKVKKSPRTGAAKKDASKEDESIIRAFKLDKGEGSNKTVITPKKPSKIIEPARIHEILEEDTVPEDFTLQIEESMDAQTELKENKVEEVMLEKVKHPRRVPLITLASPKSKKKPADT